MEPHSNRNNRRRAGFSMIEVLVASSILVVIVMMMGMLFQQTSLAWRTGSKRADGYMQIRGFIGALQRDASAAIDATGLQRARQSINPTDALIGEKQKFKGSRLVFYTLTGTGTDTDKNRVLTQITYDTAGNRTEKVLQANGTWGAEKRSNVMTFAERLSSRNKPKVTVEDFESYFGTTADNLDSDGLPLYITVETSVQSGGYRLEIGAASAGKDKTWNTKDDIKTWE